MKLTAKEKTRTLKNQGGGPRGTGKRDPSRSARDDESIVVKHDAQVESLRPQTARPQDDYARLFVGSSRVRIADRSSEKELQGPFLRQGRRRPGATWLAAGDGAYDQEGFGAGDDGVGEGCVRGLVGEVFAAGEEAEEGAAFLGDVVANSAAEHWVTGFENVESGAEGDGSGDVEFDFAGDFGEIAEMRGKNDTNHGCLVFESNKKTENEKWKSEIRNSLDSAR